MWQVRLIGPRESLEKLAASSSGDDVNISIDGGGGVLTGVELERFTEPMAVVQHAKTLIELRSGILSLESDFTPVQVGPLNRVVGTRTEAFAIGAELCAATATMSGAGSLRDSDGRPKENDCDRNRQLRELASREPVVADFLGRHTNHAHDWAGLYKLYEIVRNDVGGEHVLYAKRWITRDERSLFTNTADNSHAAGRAARHAASKTAPPAVPMSLGEAKLLVRRLGTAWLNEKLEQLPQHL